MTAEKRHIILLPELSLVGLLLLGSSFISTGCWEKYTPGDHDSDDINSDGCVGSDCSVDTAGDTAGQSDDSETNSVSAYDSDTSSSQDDSDTPNIELNDLDRSIFDPEKVYIHGTLSEGASYRDAVAQVESPNVFVVGFETLVDDCGVSQDGRYYYSWSDNSYLFNCDGCPGWTQEEYYPAYPTNNDEIIIDPCPDEVGHHRLKAGINGEFLYDCRDGIWRTTDGTETNIEEPISYGYENKVLNQLDGPWDGPREFEIVDVSTGTTTAVTDESGAPFEVIPWAARVAANPIGFWLASGVELETESEVKKEAQYTLWHIDHAGVATFIADYPLPPEEFTISYIAVLDSTAGLYVTGRDLFDTISDAVAYLNIDGTTEIIYTEVDEPIVKMHASSLVTGP